MSFLNMRNADKIKYDDNIYLNQDLKKYGPKLVPC